MSDPFSSAVFDDPEQATKEWNRLRRDTGTDDTIFDDPAIDEFFVEAEESYPDDQTKMKTYARVLVIRGLLASSALLGKYAQNQAEEDFTKVYDHLKDWLDYWSEQVGIVADPVDQEAVVAFFFGTASGNRGY